MHRAVHRTTTSAQNTFLCRFSFFFVLNKKLKIVPTPSHAVKKHKLNIVKCQCVHGRGISKWLCAMYGLKLKYAYDRKKRKRKKKKCLCSFNFSSTVFVSLLFKMNSILESAKSNERSNKQLKNDSNWPWTFIHSQDQMK